jgi:hypothetical protein
MVARSFATRTYGNLKDSDRIFTNLYGRFDSSVKGAVRRVSHTFIAALVSVKSRSGE